MANSLYEFYSADVSGDEKTYTEAGSTAGILAQTFTIGTTGTNENHDVQEIKLHLTKSGTPTGNLIIEIREAVSASVAGEVLASGSIAMSDISSKGWYTCSNLRGNTQLEASTQYFLCINHLGTTTAANYISWWGNDSSSGYSGGQAIYSEDNGATWDNLGEIFDFAFQIFGGPYNGTMCTYQDVMKKVGSGANSDATSVEFIGNLVQQAESIINARTKTDWTTLFPALKENVKYIFSELVSSIAAIKVINYDMSGYSSRLEAGDMIMQLRWGTEKLINELKRNDIQSFIKNL